MPEVPSTPTITDWLMVAITFVYVVATIFICYANMKSAKATREQIEETKRQYNEEHRPFVSYQFIYLNRTWYGMRFTNNGRRVANHVIVDFNKDFVDSISSSPFSKTLKMIEHKEFVLGIGQSYDIFFGADEFRSNPNIKPIAGRIKYQDNSSTYEDTFEINFENYAPIFSVNEPPDDIHDYMKAQALHLKDISASLKSIDYQLSASKSESSETHFD